MASDNSTSCASVACKNGGSCAVTGLTSFKCACGDGYTGQNCETMGKLFGQERVRGRHFFKAAILKWAKQGERPTILNSHSEVSKDFIDQKAWQKRCVPATNFSLSLPVDGVAHRNIGLRLFVHRFRLAFWSIKSFKMSRQMRKKGLGSPADRNLRYVRSTYQYHMKKDYTDGQKNRQNSAVTKDFSIGL